MMTFKQAKTALKKLINSQEYKDLSAKEKQQEIFKISKKVNADREGTKTVLYSGSINGKSTGDIAEEMAGADSNIRIINKTDIGTFLDSPAFKDAIYATVDVDYDTYVKNELSPEKREIAENLNNQLIYNGKDGFWAEASKRFVSSAKDETLLLIGEPRKGKLDKDTVFYQVEFEEVVKNKNITTINGIDKSKYLDLLNFNQEEGLLTPDQLKAVKAITKATENETINFKKLSSISDKEKLENMKNKTEELTKDNNQAKQYPNEPNNNKTPAQVEQSLISKYLKISIEKNKLTETTKNFNKAILSKQNIEYKKLDSNQQELVNIIRVEISKDKKSALNFLNSKESKEQFSVAFGNRADEALKLTKKAIENTMGISRGR